MTPSESAERLRERFGEVVLDVVEFRGEVSAAVATQSIREVALYCRDDLGYAYLSDISAVDWLDRKPRFDVVYHLLSLQDWIRFRLKVLVDPDEAVPTVTPVWKAAGWPEREVYDLFGIEFAEHPDLRRILLPDGWVGYPLRKDFAQSQITLPRPRADKVIE